MFSFTRVPFWVPIFDPHPYESCCQISEFPAYATFWEGHGDELRKRGLPNYISSSPSSFPSSRSPVLHPRGEKQDQRYGSFFGRPKKWRAPDPKHWVISPPPPREVAPGQKELSPQGRDLAEGAKLCEGGPRVERFRSQGARNASRPKRDALRDLCHLVILVLSLLVVGGRKPLAG